MRILKSEQFIEEKMKVVPISNTELDKVNSDVSNIASFWKENDIIYGYDGIVPDFYKIIEKHNESLVLIKLKINLVKGTYDDKIFFVEPGQTNPYFGKFYISILNDNTAKIDNYSLYKWDGTPLKCEKSK